MCVSCSAACTQACERYSGVWNDEKKVCVVQMYLSGVCLRIHRNNNTDSWSIDMPP